MGPQVPLHDAHSALELGRLGADRAQQGVLDAVRVVRVAQERLAQLGGRPANSLSTSAPPESPRQATYSLATRFMPSRSGVTIMTSAAT